MVKICKCMDFQPSIIHFCHYARVIVQTPFKPFIFKQIRMKSSYRIIKKLKKVIPKNENGQI